MAKYRSKKIDVWEVEKTVVRGDIFYRVYFGKNGNALYSEKEFHEKFEKVENQSEVL